MAETHIIQLTLTDDEAALLIAGFTATDALMCGKTREASQALVITNQIGMQHQDAVKSLRNKLTTMLGSTRESLESKLKAACR